MIGTATTSPVCPKCASDMWDNRVGKTNPKAPDFKCKDKACDGVIWPPKNGKPPAAKATDKKPVSYGTPGFLDDADEQDAAELKAKTEPDEAAVMLQSYLDLTAWGLQRVPKI